jgi:hypothetical protein
VTGIRKTQEIAHRHWNEHPRSPAGWMPGNHAGHGIRANAG